MYTVWTVGFIHNLSSLLAIQITAHTVFCTCSETSASTCSPMPLCVCAQSRDRSSQLTYKILPENLTRSPLYLQNPALRCWRHTNPSSHLHLTMIISWFSPATYPLKVFGIVFVLSLFSTCLQGPSPAPYAVAKYSNKGKNLILWRTKLSPVASKLFHLSSLSSFCFQWSPLWRPGLYKIPWCWN